VLCWTSYSLRGLLQNVKNKGSFGCSDHEMVDFRILRVQRRVKRKITTLDFRRADVGLQTFAWKKSHGIRP